MPHSSEIAYVIRNAEVAWPRRSWAHSQFGVTAMSAAKSDNRCAPLGLWHSFVLHEVNTMGLAKPAARNCCARLFSN